jgi:hypothetical protein
MAFMRILVATVLCIERIRRHQFLDTVPSGQLAGRVMVLYESRREKEGEANDYGYESTDFELRNDKALVPYAAWLPMPSSRSGV